MTSPTPEHDRNSEIPSVGQTGLPPSPEDLGNPHHHRSLAQARVIAAIEVFLCSGFPTQVVLALALGVVGVGPIEAGGQLSLLWVVALSLGDALLILCLVFYFLSRHGENPWDVFVGARSLGTELRLGVLLVPLVLVLAAASITVVHSFWPELRNVPKNPFEALIRSPVNAAIFAVVAVIAGGVREELQRAFILWRFEQHLGNRWIGLIIFSVAFGLGHQIQGWDAAVVTGLLGLFWGMIYLTRRCVIPAMVSHAGFNLAEIAVAVIGFGVPPG